MRIPILLLALAMPACGPAPNLLASYHGELIDHEGQPHDCILEITPTAPDRVHIHLDYGEGLCDGDGAFILDDVLIPDGGGEILINTYTLRGNFFSATGLEYWIELTARAARPGSGRAAISNNPPGLPAGG